MKKSVFYALTILIALVAASCSSHGDDDEDAPKFRTLIMYLPPTGSYSSAAGLYNSISSDIEDIKTAIVNNQGLGDNNFVIFRSEMGSKNANLIDVKYADGVIVLDTLKHYDEHVYSTVE